MRDKLIIIGCVLLFAAILVCRTLWSVSESEKDDERRFEPVGKLIVMNGDTVRIVGRYMKPLNAAHAPISTKSTGKLVVIMDSTEFDGKWKLSNGMWVDDEVIKNSKHIDW